MAVRSVDRGAEAAGYCSSEAPPNSQPVSSLIRAMRRQLDNRRIHHERGNTMEWTMTVSGMHDQLRKGWERAVEEVLSPVIKRLSKKIDTKHLSKVTVLTVEDCRTMRDGYGRCSALLHSSAETLNPRLPAPGAIEAEIDVLEAWIEDLKRRQRAVAPGGALGRV